MKMVDVIAIKPGFHDGGLRIPGTKTERFQVPWDQANASPWWRPANAPAVEAPDVFGEPDTMSGLAAEERKVTSKREPKSKPEPKLIEEKED